MGCGTSSLAPPTSNWPADLIPITQSPRLVVTATTATTTNLGSSNASIGSLASIGSVISADEGSGGGGGGGGGSVLATVMTTKRKTAEAKNEISSSSSSSLPSPTPPSPPQIQPYAPFADLCTRVSLRRRYRLLRRIGSGSYAEVWAAQDRSGSTGTGPSNSTLLYAIKRVRPVTQKTAREVELLHRIGSHPHVVGMREAIWDPRGRAFIVMELVEGEDLLALINRRQGLSEDWARSTVHNIASALDHMHGNGIAHLDVKPENIMMAKTGSSSMVLVAKDGQGGEEELEKEKEGEERARAVESEVTVVVTEEADGGAALAGDENTRVSCPVAKLCDFGESVFFESGNKQHTELAGTLYYCAPEVLAGRFDPPRADMWSLGVTLYAALTGELPFIGPTKALTRHRIFNAPLDTSPLRGFSEQCRTLVASLLDRDPARRPSAAEVLTCSWLRRSDV